MQVKLNLRFNGLRVFFRSMWYQKVICWWCLHFGVIEIQSISQSLTLLIRWDLIIAISYTYVYIKVPSTGVHKITYGILPIMELKIFFLPCHKYQRENDVNFHVMQKDLIVLFAGSVEYFRPWEKLVLGGLHRIWRRTLPMSWKVQPSFMSHIIINLNTFSYPNFGIKQQYFWNCYAHIMSTLIYIVYNFFLFIKFWFL